MGDRRVLHPDGPSSGAEYSDPPRGARERSNEPSPGEEEGRQDGVSVRYDLHRLFPTLPHIHVVVPLLP